MSMSERIRHLRRNKKWTQSKLAKHVNVSPQVISNWERNYSTPDADDIKRIADALETSVDYLLARNRPDLTDASNEIIRETLHKTLTENTQQDLIRIPVLGSIRAGIPLEMVRESGTDYELVERDLIHNHESFILRVQGSSMIGDQIYDGDRVVVIYTPDFTPSDICVVAIDGEEATLKRVKCQSDICVLTPSNREMEPMVYPANDVHVIGVVVEVRRRLKR